MMRRLSIFVVLIIMCIPFYLNAQQYPLQVVVTPDNNFTPYLGEFKENPGKYLSLRVNALGSGNVKRNIYFVLRMKQLSPATKVFVYSNIERKPILPIEIAATGSTPISVEQMQTNFGTHTYTDFEYGGIIIDNINDISKALKLPEGTYQLCFIAYDYDVPFGEEPKALSDPNTSCATVKVCYTAAQPQWIVPILTSQGSGENKKEIPLGRFLKLQWKPPYNTCGVNMTPLTYDLKIVKLEEAQSQDDAIQSNPRLLEESNLTSNFINIDTMQRQGVFHQGNTYVAQVRAKSANESIEIANEGKSPTIAMHFTLDTTSVDKEEGKEKEKEKSGKSDTLKVFASDIDCGVELPKNMTPIDKLSPGDEVSIGKFTLKINEIATNSANLYKGNGIVIKPVVGDFQYFNWVNVVVDFDSLSVNSEKQVVAGYAKAQFNNDVDIELVEFCSSFGNNEYYSKKIKPLLQKGENYGKGQNVIKQLLDKYSGEAKIATQMFGITAQKMPIRLHHNIGGYDIDVAVSDMKFTPKGSTFSLVYLMEIPEVDQVIPFGLYNLCMDGNPVQNGTFCLLQDIEIPLGSSNIQLFIKGGKDNTFIEWTNKEFRGVHLAAELVIPKESGVINAVDESLPVKANIKTSFIKWGDWIAEINVEKFKSVHVPDFVFEVKKAVYDHSDYKNPPEYDNAINEIISQDPSYKKVGNNFLGLFIQEATMELPNYITGSKAQTPTTLFVKNLLFEDKGLSAAIGAKNILNLETGNLGGWQFSIDEIGFLFVQGSFRKGGMNGKIKIPLNENDSYMTYECALSKPKDEPMQYLFTVVPTIDYKFLQYFTAKIHPSSVIEVKSVENAQKERETVVRANFNGSLSVKAMSMDFKLLSFTDMIIANRDEKNNPDFYFDFGKWGVGGIPFTDKGSGGGNNSKNKNIVDNNGTEAKDDNSLQSSGDKPLFKIGPFSVQFDKPKFDVGKAKDITAENISNWLTNKSTVDKLLIAKANKTVLAKKLTLKLPMYINLGNGDSRMAQASGEPELSVNLAFDYKFSCPPAIYGLKFDIKKIGIAGEFGPVRLKGQLEIFDDDKVFGDGFKGSIICKFPMDIMAKATVQFGEVKKEPKNINYFYVDGAVNLGDAAAVPLCVPIAMTGFGAGVWKNMKISNPNISIKRPETLDTEVNKYNIDDETSNQDIDISSISGVGQSATGYEFVPVDDGSSFGIKGEMYIAADRAAGGSRVLNGKVSITATTANGKFESILLAGEVHAIGDGKQKYVVDATAEIGYNHPSRQFHINVNVEADFLGFMSATIPFELKVDGLKKEWFVGIGKPLYGSGETFSIAYGFDLSVVKMKSSLEGYICGGNMVPYDMPELPKAILDVLKMKPTKSSFPKGSATAGFMLGARYSFEFDFNFGPLYAGLYSLIGFDLEMRNRSGAVCGNGDKIGGINGYYCQGQIYGYISGDIGVQLKFFGKTKKFSLCSITAGAMLKAGLPNPTWMKGAVGVKGEILGGLVKFHTTAKFSIGNECKTLSDPLKDLIVVESISPGSASLSEANSVSKKPSIFTSPKIACNVRMNQDFDLYSDDGEQQVKRIYKFEFKDITYAEANNLSSKVTIKNFIDLSQKNNEFVLRSADMLKPFTNYMVKVRVQIREWRQGSYKLPWGENKEYTDAEATQEKVVYFKTGEKPDVIHPDNIRESYPMENQFETFVKNGQKGYIVLEHSQKYLFDNRDKSLGKEALYGEYINRAIPNSKPVKFLYDYISANPYNYIQFDMKDLAASSIYECKFYVVNSKQKEAEFIVKTKEEEIINREYVDKPIDLPKLPGGTFQSKGSTGGVGGSNRFNSLTTNKNLTNNSPGITYSGNLIKKFQFGEVSSLTKVSEKGKYYSSNQDASDSDKAKLSKAEQEQKAAQINANIKGIFKYHFRTSQYNSVENKMKTIQLYYGDLMDRYCQIKWTNQKNTTEKEGEGIGKLSNPYLTSYFPYWTSKEEVFGGKSFEDGSNAEYQPAMFQYYATLKGDGSQSDLEDTWKTTCMDFLNMIRPGCSEFDLPYTRTGPLTLETFRNANNNVSNWYRVESSNKVEDYEGRLTSGEIMSGRVMRSPKSNRMTHIYTHIACVAYHFQYAAVIADDFIDKNPFYNPDSRNKGFTNVRDNFASASAGNLGCKISLTYKQANDNGIFCNLLHQAKNIYYCKPDIDVCGDKWKEWKNSCYDYMKKNPNKCYQFSRSNTFWLHGQWKDNYKKKWNEQSLYPVLRNLRIGRHDVNTYYYRLGGGWNHVNLYELNFK